MTPTRRTTLLAGLFALLPPPLRGRGEVGGEPALRSSAAARIGAAYLRANPTDTLADIRPIAYAPRSHIAARGRADFAAGRIVTLDGWMLSETEARLCALTLV